MQLILDSRTFTSLFTA
jgi:hypothetical protein